MKRKRNRNIPLMKILVRPRIILLFFAVILLFILSYKQVSLINSNEVEGSSIIWSTGMETGDISDWLINQSEAVFNTGTAKVSVTDEVAHSGKFSLKHEVWDIDKQRTATRIFRWGERLSEGYFSCWYMLPTLPKLNNNGWLLIYQFKKGDPKWEPTYYNRILNRDYGTTLALTQWPDWRDSANLGMDIPWVSKPPALVANKWFHLEWYYKDGISDGAIKVWQDGQLLWNLSQINTRMFSEVTSQMHWAPSLYGQYVTPGYLTMYIDDCAISNSQVGPGGSGSTSTPSPTQSTPILSPTSTKTPTIQPTATTKIIPTSTRYITPTQTPRPKLTLTPTPALNTTYVWEAEDGTLTKPFVVTNGYISQKTSTSKENAGKAVYNVIIQKKSEYILEALVDAANDGSNSFYISIDQYPDERMIWDIPVTKGFEKHAVAWRGTAQPASFTLSPGYHSIIIQGREANTKIDTLWLIEKTSTQGLWGEYFNTENFTQPAFSRVDPYVNFRWGHNAPSSLIASDSFSVRWSAVFAPQKTGMYYFYVTSDDGSRLWVNNQKIIDDWTTHLLKERRGSISLEKGKKYSLRLEYFDRTGVAGVSLFYLPPGGQKALLPTEYLIPSF